ncbi:hypothetical protein COT75_02155 [Candidatus Beckwithbacteria bacterium CG10_big_fil_rev_8_21_14_0_10_34_10]|uniref:Glycosyltransferase RgtA/B/C/D-like domain-containing protein n=1 Tax=Candidatus Beckwithbacteria bacterium CG10_big_fil_rev_8_21_14_0_10_34_10 TaxID=1974495 RepID=A0A2H0W9F1_9BACT|nr:MAG: hypothetical protein COT75_02155 [Candidatus Beckwithbacteria bacterium CG10_big_fil_rev_8_21_14_0_10_34_10]
MRQSAKKIRNIKLILLGIIILNLILRTPSLFDPVSYGDECIYLTLGQAFNKGFSFYRDIHDNKPPFLYFMAALAGGKLFWLRLITIIWNSLNIILIYKLGKKLFKKKEPGLLGAFLFFIFTFLPEGRIANGEIFMVLPASLGLYFSLKATDFKTRVKKIVPEKKKNIYWFLTGFFFSLAFLFKVPIAFDFIGLILGFFVFLKKKPKNILSSFKEKPLYLAIFGFSLPIVLSIFYYTLKGAFVPYFRSALLQNIGYLSSWGGSNIGLYIRALLILILTVFLFRWRQKLSFVFCLLFLMTLYGLFGVFLSERPYPHYLIEIAPWLALLLVQVLKDKNKKEILLSLVLFLLTIFGVFNYKYWWYPNLPYYKNFIKFGLKISQKDDFFRFFGEKTLNDYRVAKYLKIRSQKQDNLFVWGDGACIYALSERLPPGRYTVNYHIYDFNGYSETLGAIKEKKPKFIVLLDSAKKDFPELRTHLALHYFKVNQIGEAIIYKKIVNN